MKLNKRLGIISFVLIGCAWMALYGTAQPQPGQKKDDERQMIAKDQIYTTSPESGFKERLHALFFDTKKGENRKPVHPYSFDLDAIGKQHSVSSVFLVRGKDVSEAIASTTRIHVDGYSPDSPPDQDIYGKPIKSENYWLVVYLGTSHSEPPRWKFKSCVVADTLIEFTYEPREITGEPMGSSTDSIQYFYWVPLPPLKKGTFELKLIEAKKKQPRLIRFVDVP